MTLGEAFTLLGLSDPLAFEMRALGHQDLNKARRLGTTTRMLVEATLDTLEGRNVCVYVATRSMAADAKSSIMRFQTVLGRTEKMGELQVTTAGIVPRHPNMVVYHDHYRDPISGEDCRVIGPFAQIHYVMVDITKVDAVAAYNREDVFLGTISTETLQKLRSLHYKAIPIR